jgi:hypothetical protein
MGLLWTVAGMLEAEKHFRKVIGYTDLPRWWRFAGSCFI